MTTHGSNSNQIVLCIWLKSIQVLQALEYNIATHTTLISKAKAIFLHISPFAKENAMNPCHPNWASSSYPLILHLTLKLMHNKVDHSKASGLYDVSGRILKERGMWLTDSIPLNMGYLPIDMKKANKTL